MISHPPKTLFLQDVRLRVQGFQDGMEDEQPHGNPASEIFAVEADPDIAVLAADMVGPLIEHSRLAVTVLSVPLSLRSHTLCEGGKRG
jgi:hypothetical protein